jgi:hypothetical protein
MCCQTVADFKAQGSAVAATAAAPAAPDTGTEHPDCIVVDHPWPEHVYTFLPAMFEKHRPE